MLIRNAFLAGTLALLFAGTVAAQAPPPVDKELLKSKVGALDMMNGTWRGTATYYGQDGSANKLTQTERVGPMLDGAVKVIEGRGYDDGGTVRFNAMGIISYNTSKKTLEMRSYAEGRVGDFPVEVTGDGFRWSIQSGPVTIRYTATIRDDSWVEVGERQFPNEEPIKFFEMKLKRIGKTDWPAGNPIPAK